MPDANVATAAPELQSQTSRNSFLPLCWEASGMRSGAKFAIVGSALKPARGAVTLGAAPVGFTGHICAVRPVASGSGLPPQEIERRLIELGFVEGARIEILHEGLFGRDPIAVRVDGATIALRRREAAAIVVEPESETTPAALAAE